MFSNLNMVSLESLINYITKSKSIDNDPLMDIVIDYCNKYGISEEEIGELIAEDENFRNIFENDCVANRYMISDKISKMEEW